jgi:hypothetical protein
MNISSALGLLTAMVGLTTTIHGGWKYLSSSERSKKERIGAVVIVAVIGSVVLGAAAGISHVTASTPVGQKTIPVPFVPTAAPAYPQTAPSVPTTVPTLTPTLSSSLTPTSTVQPDATVAPSPTAIPTQPATPGTNQQP